jgi:hypothetical protein
MKPDRAHIDLSFPHPVLGNFFPVKIHLEYPVGPNDTEQEALDAGKKSAEEWFASRYPHLSKEPDLTRFPPQLGVVAEIQTERSGDTLAALIADIYTCTELKVLEGYRLLAKTRPELQAAYDMQIKKLSNGLE